MVKLIAHTPCHGMLPVVPADGVKLEEVIYDPIQSIAPFAGRSKAVGEKLKEAIGAALPRPNCATGNGPKCLWVGPNQYLLLGHALGNLSDDAAITDQSDAWACVAIEGDSSVDVLARLVPVDLRPSTFKAGHTARTLIGHMAGSVTRTGARRFEIMVMRSMAQTLVHEMSEAARLYHSR